MKTTICMICGIMMIVSPLLAGSRSARFYVGKYTGTGEGGVQIVEFDPGAGCFRLVAAVEAGANPSFLCLNPQHGLLYALNEVDDFAGHKAGGITTLAIDPATGALRKAGELAVANGGPCQISLTPAGDYLLVANYGGGSVAVVRLDARGLPAAVTDTLLFQGPPGSTSRAHMILPGPDGRNIYVTDLGLDRISIFNLDHVTGKLHAVADGEVALAKGAGPRHFVFNRKGSALYVINERNSTLTVFAVAASGLLREIQTLSTMPAGFSGVNYCADLHFGKSGKFLYGTNRGHNSIVTFRVGRDGRLTLAGHTPCGGDWPRNFAIDPTGRYLLVANQRSDNLALFALDGKNGLPRPMPCTFATTAPACLKFAHGSGDWPQ